MALLGRRHPSWLLGLVFASVLALAGCGSSAMPAASPGRAGQAGRAHDMESMAVAPIELPADGKVPRLAWSPPRTP